MLNAFVTTAYFWRVLLFYVGGRSLTAELIGFFFLLFFSSPVSFLPFFDNLPMKEQMFRVHKNVLGKAKESHPVCAEHGRFFSPNNNMPGQRRRHKRQISVRNEKREKLQLLSDFFCVYSTTEPAVIAALPS